MEETPTFKELYADFEKAAGKIYAAIDKVPKDDQRYPELFAFKSKLQSVMGEGYLLQEKWENDESMPWPLN